MIAFAKSFRHAADGIRNAASTERNFRIELILGLAATVLLFLLPLSSAERGIVLLTIGVVLSLELLNTAVEHLMDVLSPQYHEAVKATKDITAGAVLLASVFAVFVGIVVFLPHIIPIFSGR
ncbi:MAG: diacylglycerol kinase family protein [Candidatus Moranbacteria bacterium]|nr:diacylglycerol kinase family protein [Candidatus Moranbacteria bacterium]